MKQSFYVVTDSTSDLRPAEKTKYDIRVIPLRLMFGEQVFLDGETISAYDFYQKWETSGIDPLTSPPTPQDFYQVYKRLLDTYPDARILSIHISAGLSTTLQSAGLARSMLPKPDRVTLLDSRTVSHGLGNLVMKAGEMARNGATLEQTVMEIHKRMGRQKMFLLVDSLTHLQRGGRIGKASQLLGSLFNIKPVLLIDPEGKVTPFDKARGQKGAIIRTIEAIQAEYASKTLRVTFMHANGDAFVDLAEDLFKEMIHPKDIEIRMVCPVIGAHVGQGAVAILARWEDAN